MIKIFNRIFLSPKFFIAGAIIIVLFALSFIIQWLFTYAVIFIIILFLFTVIDLFILFVNKKNFSVERILPDLMSLGDKNPVIIKIINTCDLNVNITLYDDLPYQLQERNFFLKAKINKNETKTFNYTVFPVTRGKYVFGNITILIISSIGIIQKKEVFESKKAVSVYPSIIQMKKFEFKIHPGYSYPGGVKKFKKTGHSYEFDQIKEYVPGDDSRSINWKASSRKGTLMVNHFEDERSQQVYSIIDKSRIMRMPFNNLTLFDYSVNSVLALSNIILKKHDKAGLITFSDKIGSILPSEKNHQQLKKILDVLYNERENFYEAEYRLLFHLVRNVIKNRSLIFLYTNFESFNALERVLPILRQINKSHLLVVIFFDNEEVLNITKVQAGSVQDIYVQTIARKYLYDKNMIIAELANHGIHSIKTLPHELTVNTINKYLEFKARRML